MGVTITLGALATEATTTSATDLIGGLTAVGIAAGVTVPESCWKQGQ